MCVCVCVHACMHGCMHVCVRCGGSGDIAGRLFGLTQINYAAKPSGAIQELREQVNITAELNIDPRIALTSSISAASKKNTIPEPQAFDVLLSCEARWQSLFCIMHRNTLYVCVRHARSEDAITTGRSALLTFGLRYLPNRWHCKPLSVSVCHDLVSTDAGSVKWKETYQLRSSQYFYTLHIISHMFTNQPYVELQPSGPTDLNLCLPIRGA